MSKLDALRRLMKSHSVAGYIIPMADRHQSEYVDDIDKRIQFISSFTGSAGTAVVLEKSANLWTDGRYHQQARKELSSEWTLHEFGKAVKPEIKSWQQFLADQKSETGKFRIGFDSNLISIADYQALVPKLKDAELVSIESNLIDEIWKDQPGRTANPIFMHELKYAGESAASKLEKVRETLKESKSSGLIVSGLDEIAWVLNLRGSDIAFNPIFFAYLYIPLESAPTIFLDLAQVNDRVYQYLTKELGILVEPVSSVSSFLSQQTGHISITTTTSVALAQAISPSLTTVSTPAANSISIALSPITTLKAIKNTTEIQGFRDCNLRDGVALVKYFSWLENELNSNKVINEFEGAEKLESLRRELPGFVSLSFDTISSTGGNASIIHYKPPSTGSNQIKKEHIYLCDSGGQFVDGTTDTTRTLHFGTPTEIEKIGYTRTLQGHIAIDQAIFPPGTTGYILDLLARKELWKEGMDFAHGTSHGVGSFLNVHEGPVGIGKRLAYNDFPLKVGHVLSNEPGYYQPDSVGSDDGFGIRIENVVTVVEKKLRVIKCKADRFLGFEHFTVVPVATNLVIPELLTVAELKWLNDYNQMCFEKLEKLVEDDPIASNWLKKVTRELKL